MIGPKQLYKPASAIQNFAYTKQTHLKPPDLRQAIVFLQGFSKTHRGASETEEPDRPGPGRAGSGPHAGGAGRLGQGGRPGRARPCEAFPFRDPPAMPAALPSLALLLGEKQLPCFASPQQARLPPHLPPRPPRREMRRRQRAGGPPCSRRPALPPPPRAGGSPGRGSGLAARAAGGGAESPGEIGGRPGRSLPARRFAVGAAPQPRCRRRPRCRRPPRPAVLRGPAPAPAPAGPPPGESACSFLSVPRGFGGSLPEAPRCRSSSRGPSWGRRAFVNRAGPVPACSCYVFLQEIPRQTP